MKSLERLQLFAKNMAYKIKLGQISPKNIYARTTAQFYKKALERNGSVDRAGKIFFDNIQNLIDKDLYVYDLVVQEKNGPKIKVLDQSGVTYELLDLVTNSYNDLEWVDVTKEQLIKFIQEKPISSCISRKIAGQHTVHQELAEEVADYLGYDTCVLGTNGYITQLSTMFALFREGDVVFSDRHNHSSLVDGIRLSRAKVVVFEHCDYGHLESLLKKYRQNFNCAGIVSDGVFSTKGATCNVNRITELAKQHQCISIIDDTHGFTVVGSRGRGVIDLYDAKPDVITGGFGKALGSFGGFAVANQNLGLVINVFGRQNVNTSHMSPIIAAQSIFNLRYYRQNQKELSSLLNEIIHHFNNQLKENGLVCYPEPDKYINPIFCLYKKTETETLDCYKKLIKEGFLPSFFPPPVATYPSLRFSLHRNIPMSELTRLAKLLGTMNLFSDPGQFSQELEH